MLRPRVIAFLPTLGFSEMAVIFVIGLLLYGRNLPEAGRTLGRVAAQLRRGWLDFKDQIDRDAEIRDLKRTIQDTASEVRRVAEVPRSIADPGRALRNLTDEALASPLADDDPAAPAPTPPPVPPPTH